MQSLLIPFVLLLSAGAIVVTGAVFIEYIIRNQIKRANVGESKRRRSARLTLATIALPFFAIMTVAGLIAFALHIFTAYEGFAKSIYQKTDLHSWIIALWCAGLGLLAYFVRCRARLAYGVFETAIGIVAAFQAADSVAQTASMTFLGGLYIIVRGLDNVEKGLKYINKEDDQAKNSIMEQSGPPSGHQRWVSIFGPQV